MPLHALPQPRAECGAALASAGPNNQALDGLNSLQELVDILIAKLDPQILDHVGPPCILLGLARSSPKLRVDAVVAQVGSVPDPQPGNRMRQLYKFPSLLVSHLVHRLLRLRGGEDMCVIKPGDDADLKHSPELRLARRSSKHTFPSLKFHVPVSFQGIARQLCNRPSRGILSKAILAALRGWHIFICDLASSHDQRGCGGAAALLHDSYKLPRVAFRILRDNCYHLGLRYRAVREGASDNCSSLCFELAVGLIRHGLS